MLPVDQIRRQKAGVHALITTSSSQCRQPRNPLGPRCARNHQAQQDLRLPLRLPPRPHHLRTWPQFLGRNNHHIRNHLVAFSVSLRFTSTSGLIGGGTPCPAAVAISLIGGLISALLDLSSEPLDDISASLHVFNATIWNTAPLFRFGALSI